MLIGYTCKLTQTSTGKGKGGRGGDDLLEVAPIVRMGRQVELSECFTNLRSTLIEVFHTDTQPPPGLTEDGPK